MLHRLTISQLTDRLARREVSAREALDACLSRIDLVDGQVKAFLSVDRADAEAQAGAADRDLAAGVTHAEKPLLGVPIGLWALAYINPVIFKVCAGLFLVTFSTFMLVWRGNSSTAWGGRVADGAVGFIGGILGGMAGLSGALPTVWASLRGWGKEQKRGVFQAFNLAVLGAALVAHALAGRVTSALVVPVAVALPGTVIGAWLGVRTYHRLNDRNFSDLVMVMLLVSGTTLLYSLW